MIPNTFNSFSPYVNMSFPSGCYQHPDYKSYTDYGNNTVHSDSSVDEKTVGMAALLQAIAMGLQKGSNWLARKLESGKEFTSAENVGKITQHMVGKHALSDVSVDFISETNKHKYANSPLASEIDVVAKGQNAFYSNDLKLAVAPKSKPSLILHELGHAANSKNFLTKLLQQSRRYAVSAPMVLLFASKLIGKKEDGSQNFIEKHAGKLGFAAFLPTIIEEGLASLKGIGAVNSAPKNLLKGKLDVSILKRNYLFALGTYILAGIGLGVASKQTILENQQNG